MISSCHTHKTVYYKQCSSCLHDLAKQEKAEQKANSKKLKDIEKHKIRNAKPKKAVKKVSDKMKEALKEYKPLRKKYLAEHPECEMRLIGCEGMATDIHHTASRGINLNNVSTWKSACRECHMKLHNELSAEEAKELGLKTSAINQERQTI